MIHFHAIIYSCGVFVALSLLFVAYVVWLLVSTYSFKNHWGIYL